jgi:hypothetical protein
MVKCPKNPANAGFFGHSLSPKYVGKNAGMSSVSFYAPFKNIRPVKLGTQRPTYSCHSGFQFQEIENPKLQFVVSLGILPLHRVFALNYESQNPKMMLENQAKVVYNGC